VLEAFWLDGLAAESASIAANPIPMSCSRGVLANSVVSVWVTRARARQRAGRAGREGGESRGAGGQCVFLRFYSRFPHERGAVCRSPPARLERDLPKRAAAGRARSRFQPAPRAVSGRLVGQTICNPRPIQIKVEMEHIAPCGAAAPIHGLRPAWRETL